MRTKKIIKSINVVFSDTKDFSEFSKEIEIENITVPQNVDTSSDDVQL